MLELNKFKVFSKRLADKLAEEVKNVMKQKEEKYVKKGVWVISRWG